MLGVFTVVRGLIVMLINCCRGYSRQFEHSSHGSSTEFWLVDVLLVYWGGGGGRGAGQCGLYL